MISYTINKSKKSKRIRVSINREASVIVTIPYNLNIKYAEKFLKDKNNWILKNIEKIKNNPKNKYCIPKGNDNDFILNKEKAFKIVSEKLYFLNKKYNLKWNKITIKNTKTRWGSCSQAGNLNFSYRIVYLPSNLAEYLVAHEICHLKEMNHSKRFWGLVEQTIPDYKKLSKEIKYI